jgi:hypothetical protein
MSQPLPSVNTLVRVVVAGVAELPSRVEEACDGLLGVAAPGLAAGLDAPAPGDPVELRWTSVRGLCTVPAQVRSVNRGTPPVWRIEPCGDVRIVQRRRFVRAETSAPLTIVPIAVTGDSGRPVIGRLVDLSEASARCRVNGLTALGAAGLEVNGEAELRLSLGAAIVRVVGPVLRVFKDVPVTADDSGEVVVVFEAPEAAAELIRRYVINQQVLARRAAVDHG